MAGRNGRKPETLIRGRDMRSAGRPADAALAKAMLKLMAVGFAGGVALIAGAKKVGESMLNKAMSDIPESDLGDMSEMGIDDAPEEALEEPAEEEPAEINVETTEEAAEEAADAE